MRRPMMADPTAARERTGGDWPFWATVLVFLAAFAVMTWPWLSGRVSIPWDAKATFLPQVQFLAQSLWRGEAPWWNPYVFSGLPQVADPQSMLFSPPFVALAAINPAPGPWAGDLTVLAAMSVGGVGLIVWFRDRGWHWAGGLVGALAFVFGAAMAWRIQHWGQVLSLCYLPWVLLLVDRAVLRSSWWAGAGVGLVAAFLVLGRDQIALLAVYLLAGRVVWLWLTAPDRGVTIGRSIGPLAAGGILGLAAVAVPILMTVLLAADSNRPAIDYLGAGAGSLHPAMLTTFAVPQVFGAASPVMGDFWGPPSFTWVGTGLYTAQNVGQLYIGALPLLVLATGVATGRIWDPEIRFFTIALAVMLLYGLGWYTPFFRLAHGYLPGVDLYRRPADAVFLIGGLGAIVAGYLVHVWFAEPWRRTGTRFWWATGCVVVAALVASVVFAGQHGRLGYVVWPLLVAAVWMALAVVVVMWAAPRIALQPWQAALALALVTACDLGWNNGPNSSSSLPPETFEVLEPDTSNPTIAALKGLVVADGVRRDRVELAGLGFHWPNASIPHRLENTLGYNPVRLGDYSRATGADDHVGLPEQRKFSPLMPSYRSLLAQMLGLRWVVTNVAIEKIDPSLAGVGLAPVRRAGDNLIYELPEALPRVLFVPSARAARFDDMLTSGRWSDGFDPRATVLLEGAAGDAGQRRRPGVARIVAYGQNRIEIEATSPDGGWVVLNDVWHPWWFAETGGRRVPLERANVLFRAVEVGPGRQSVVMTFRPLEGTLAALRSSLEKPSENGGDRKSGQNNAPPVAKPK